MLGAAINIIPTNDLIKLQLFYKCITITAQQSVLALFHNNVSEEETLQLIIAEIVCTWKHVGPTVSRRPPPNTMNTNLICTRTPCRGIKHALDKVYSTASNNDAADKMSTKLKPPGSLSIHSNVFILLHYKLQSSFVSRYTFFFSYFFFCFISLSTIRSVRCGCHFVCINPCMM